ncbi:DUF721 domain-containing protein [Actibacterium pelagium]|uniref:Zn-ribbon-containing, possibly RNA-binding protein and truncated derivatives n=1 Tax=Actibacterium pelagium TaxID=2029103 RepID=A0A917EK84_9RHOB|nr:DUF721 domain-containing protein [Actibacterium pelagium]GGE56161.1 hypothetical protein GCM10011517_24740 [Actibacterium pelagium]
MSKPEQQNSPPKRRKRGFERAAGLLSDRIRQAGETRGFALSRLLTHWEEIVGPETADHARPVKVSYSREGFGATLTLLTPGAMGPMLEMQKEQIRDKVNACYGYAAISRVRFTQTAAMGFAEDKPGFKSAPKRREPTQAEQEHATKLASSVQDDTLRQALERLGGHVLTRSKS